MSEIMIKIKNTWLEKYYCKDLVSLEDILDLLEDKFDEVDYLEQEIQELKNKQYDKEMELSDRYYEDRKLGLMNE